MLQIWFLFCLKTNTQPIKNMKNIVIVLRKFFILPATIKIKMKILWNCEAECNYLMAPCSKLTWKVDILDYLKLIFRWSVKYNELTIAYTAEKLVFKLRTMRYKSSTISIKNVVVTPIQRIRDPPTVDVHGSMVIDGLYSRSKLEWVSKRRFILTKFFRMSFKSSNRFMISASLTFPISAWISL